MKLDLFIGCGMKFEEFEGVRFELLFNKLIYFGLMFCNVFKLFYKFKKVFLYYMCIFNVCVVIGCC